MAIFTIYTCIYRITSHFSYFPFAKFEICYYSCKRFKDINVTGIKLSLLYAVLNSRINMLIFNSSCLFLLCWGCRILRGRNFVVLCAKYCLISRCRLKVKMEAASLSKFLYLPARLHSVITPWNHHLNCTPTKIPNFILHFVWEISLLLSRTFISKNRNDVRKASRTIEPLENGRETNLKIKTRRLW